MLEFKERGNYIMYARATSGDKINNNKFSICSIRNISQVLDKKRGLCFVGTKSSRGVYFFFNYVTPALPKCSLSLFFFEESGQPICGNGLVEAGEQCDCGYSDQCKDVCCHSANEPDNQKCKLKLGASCRYAFFNL